MVTATVLRHGPLLTKLSTTNVADCPPTIPAKNRNVAETLARPSLGRKLTNLSTTQRTRPCFPPGGTNPLTPLSKNTILTPLPPRTVEKVKAVVTLATILRPRSDDALKIWSVEILTSSTIASLCLLLNIPIQGRPKWVAIP